MDNKLLFLIICPPALIIVLLVTAYSFPLERDWSGAEKQVLTFKKADLEVKEKEHIPIKRNMTGPLEISPPKRAKAIDPDAVGEENEEEEEIITVSLIVISGGEKMAVIEGMTVREGDIYAEKRVAKIEPDRVMLKSKISQWIYIGE